MVLESQSSNILRFGVFEADLHAGELRKQGKRIRLQEQPFQVLMVLLQRPGEVVTREELRNHNWSPDTFVDFDNSLNTAINKLREALDDSADNPRFIETLPRRGYRFVAPVTGPDGVDTARIKSGQGRTERRLFRWIIAVVSFVALAFSLFSLNVLRVRDRLLGRGQVPRIQSLAVLPLTNLSGDPAQEYFSDGMTDALITDLAQIGFAKVISRTSVMRYKRTDKLLPEIARELNVDGIVEGTVQRSGGRVRVTAQLIHGPSDRHLWASSYERELRDVLGLQDELARAIVYEIRVKLTPQEQTRLASHHAVNPKAYDLYLQGLVYSRREGLESKRTSLDYFNRALQIDPEWAEPSAQIARSDEWIADAGKHAEFWPQAKAAALTAIRLDDNLAEAHVALGYALFNYDWDWVGAEREFQRALSLNPNYSEAHLAYSQLLMAAGRRDDAVNEVRRAEELDPLQPIVRVIVGMVYSCVGRQDESIEQLQNTTKLNPEYDVGFSALGIAFLRKGMYLEAIANLEKALAMDKDDPDVILDVVELAYAYAAAGRKKEAQKMLRTLEKAESNGRDLGNGLYPIYFALGEKERALAWLEKAFKVRSQSLLYLRCWPEFDRMRTDPRFADLVRRVGIPP